MKNYFPTNHAVDQAVERFGKSRQSARSWINTLMQTAYYQGTDNNGRIYDNQNQRVRMILDLKKDAVITLYSMDTEKPPKIYDVPFGDVIAATIRRELTKARRQFTANFRHLSEQLALKQIELGRLSLNKVRCKHPGTQAIIQRNIDEITAEFNDIAAKIAKEQAEYNRVKTEAQAFIGTEVSV